MRPPPSGPRPAERVFTPALLGFLTLVAAALGAGAWGCLGPQTPAAAITALADGDLDGAERQQVMRDLVRGVAAEADPTAQWGRLLAAVALGDRAGYEDAAARLRAEVPGNATVLPPTDRRCELDLGDPLLGNLGQALWTEAGGDRAGALLRWRQVVAQCRLVPAPLAAELATAAIERLR